MPFPSSRTGFERAPAPGPLWQGSPAVVVQRPIRRDQHPRRDDVLRRAFDVAAQRSGIALAKTHIEADLGIPAAAYGLGAGLAGGIALVNTCGLVGGFIGPTAMGLIEQATGSTRNGLLIIAALLVAAALASTRLRQGQETG